MNQQSDAFVVGTAGHIDHGKSALVKALTGIDPDRLEEEKRRGMTIDLGFAYLELPGGRRVGIVDVPGHRRFLKNMLAGVHGMDAVLLVIAADEGPMPQTREHLAIVDLLQISKGVVVISKADLVDAAWLSLVREEVTELLKESGLRDAPLLPVSSTTGKGVDELRAALNSVLATLQPRPDLGRPRLPVDRSFAVAGFGTVVTGTLIGGALTVGTEVAVLPAGRLGRIRGLQQHNQDVVEARPGTRTAVNLSGLGHSDISRGDLLALPASLPTTRRLDVRLALLPEVKHSLRHGQQLMLYHATAEHLVELSLLEGDQLQPGAGGLAQLFSATPMVALPGDRFILRVPSPPQTVAGGVILDVAPRRHRRRDATVLQSLQARVGADAGATVSLEVAKHPLGVTLHELESRLGSTKDQLAVSLSELQSVGRVKQVGLKWLSASAWNSLGLRITRVLEDFHRGQPLRRGMPREQVRSKVGIPADLFSAAVSTMVADGALEERLTELALSGHRAGLSQEQEAAAAALLAELELQPFNPPPLADLMSRHRISSAVLQYLVQENRLVRLNDETVFARSAYEQAVERLRHHLNQHRTLTVASARDVLGSSRRYVLPLLEWLDAQKITRRVGDDRILRD
jgi:selenocysteine-specific elongation factor